LLLPVAAYKVDVLPMTKKEKDPNAVALGRKGGKARLRTMTPEQRKEIARKAVAARWAKAKIKKDK
jgi:hypothetical protein